MRKLALALLCFTSAFCDTQVKSPAQIQAELDEAQATFERAQKMFIPYYTGPLITASATNVPMGHTNIQPYLYLTDTYAAFNSKRRSIDQTNIFTIQPLFLWQYGLTHWLDINIIAQGYLRWRKGQSAQRFGDSILQFGLQALTETPYRPKIRITLTETFPSGQYTKLSPNKGGIDSTGSGTCTFTPGIIISKVLWWFPLHPMSIRLAMDYNIPNYKAKVKGFHTYGGGFDTNGRIKVGQSYDIDLGVEWSITQRWVFATDFVWTQSFKSTFSGTEGTAKDGTVAVNGLPSSDNFSISPAIEYSPNDTGGFIGGIWLPVTGRNSSNFVSLVMSYTQLF
ncbi:MAG: hypothetical protein MRY21_08100 [Simkaniaceae bacterium]|nr:hypothetical protein [Simkaniaceae bacterium]